MQRMILLASWVFSLSGEARQGSLRRSSWKEGRSMNAKEDRMRGKQRQAIQQTSNTLPCFDEEVPVLSLSSTPSVPVIALCEMLGLRLFCGMWTVCYSTRETETSFHLLPGGFYEILTS